MQAANTIEGTHCLLHSHYPRYTSANSIGHMQLRHLFIDQYTSQFSDARWLPDRIFCYCWKATRLIAFIMKHFYYYYNYLHHRFHKPSQNLGNISLHAGTGRLVATCRSRASRICRIYCHERNHKLLLNHMQPQIYNLFHGMLEDLWL
jgi:hypothetical protein